MKRNASLIAVTLFALTLATAAIADPNTPRVDRREVRQDVRIDRGVHRGALTPAEEARLRAGQAHVDRAEARAKSDGVVSGAERRRLAEIQNHQSRMIARKKHNARGC